MIFKPEKLSIPDRRMEPFINADEIWSLINAVKPTKERVREVISKSLSKERLTLAETAVLINTTDPVLIEEINKGARTLKKKFTGTGLFYLPHCMLATDALISENIAVLNPKIIRLSEKH